MKASELLNSGKYTTINSQVFNGIMTVFIRDDKKGLEGTLKVKVKAGIWGQIIEDQDVKEG